MSNFPISFGISNVRKNMDYFLDGWMLAISGKRGKVGGQQFSLNPLLEIHC